MRRSGDGRPISSNRCRVLGRGNRGLGSCRPATPANWARDGKQVSRLVGGLRRRYVLLPSVAVTRRQSGSKQCPTSLRSVTRWNFIPLPVERSMQRADLTWWRNDLQDPAASFSTGSNIRPSRTSASLGKASWAGHNEYALRRLEIGVHQRRRRGVWPLLRDSRRRHGRSPPPRRRSTGLHCSNWPGRQATRGWIRTTGF